MGVTDEQSLAAWTEFLTEYAESSIRPPAHPPLLTDELQRKLDCDDSGSSSSSCGLPGAKPLNTAIYQPGQIDKETARRVRDFYCEYKFLPPPRSSKEALRLRVLADYDISGEEQMRNLQDSTELISAFFPGVLCTFSLFKGDEQYHYAVAGPEWIKAKYNVYVGVRIPSEDSLCGHAVLGKGGEPVCQVLAGDWRYKNNPFRMAGFKSYAASVVRLPLDPSATGTLGGEDDEEQVGIGTINMCFIDSMPRDLTEDQKNVTARVTRNLSTQLRATWEGHRRTKVARIQRGLSDYIRDALETEVPGSSLVGPSGMLKAATPKTTTGTEGNGELNQTGVKASNDEWGKNKKTNKPKEMGLTEMAEDTCRRLAGQCLQVDTLLVIDLRAVRAISGRQNETVFVQDSESPFPVKVVARFSTDYQGKVKDDVEIQLLLDYLQTTISSNPTVNIAHDSHTSAFEAILPVNTETYFATPFFSGNDPIFMIIATSTKDRPRLDESDQIAIGTFGSILRARSVQANLISSDRAKTAFLSSISHELRTPMHGVLTSLELLRGAAAERDIEQINMLVKVATSSGKTLQRLLNDVLDFGSLKTSSNRETEVNLAKTAEAMAATCALRLDQSPVPVELLVEYEDRPWEAMIDEAGYQRILINGLTNAIKFTTSGSITLMLTLSPDQKRVIIRIIDTGIGISSDFRAHLYEPFAKFDEFSPGAGLGLHITKSLVGRMSGTLALNPNKNQPGSTFEVILPISVSSQASSSRMIRKQIYTPPNDLWESQEHRPLHEANGSSGVITPPSPVISTDQQRLRVLVVDDNVVNRKLLSLAIKKSPYKPSIKQANDGKQAIEVFRTFSPHLIFTDISMPVMDGLTATSRIRDIEHDQNPGLPCIIYALTGLGTSDVRLRLDSLMGKAALNGWLVKGQHDMQRIAEIIDSTVQRFGFNKVD